MASSAADIDDETSSDRSFGEYVLVERLASEDLLESYRAKRPGQGRDEKYVTITRLTAAAGALDGVESQFVNEAKTAARLVHPSIVRIYDFGKVRGQAFVATEHGVGERLRVLLGRCEERGLFFPHELAATIAARVAAGLEHAHTKSDERGRPLHIVHLGVSPRTICVSEQGEVKLVDFGIARLAAERWGGVPDEEGYASPEQLGGAPVDARSDVFGAGLVLYEILTGRRYLRVRARGEDGKSFDPWESARVGLRDPGAPRAAEIPNVLREVIRRALAPRPADRFASAAEMVHALEELIGDASDPRRSEDLGRFVRLLGEPWEGTGSAPQGPGVEPLPKPSVGEGGASGFVRTDPSPSIASAPPAPASPAADEPVPATGAAHSGPPAAPQAGFTPVPGDRAALGGIGGCVVATVALAYGVGRALIGSADDGFVTPLAVPASNSAVVAVSARVLDGAEAEHAHVRALLDEARRLRREDPAGAVQRLNAVLAIDPGSAEAHHNLGYLEFRQRRFEQAIVEYEAAAKQKPVFFQEICFNLSLLYEHVGRKGDAIEAVRRGLVEFPSSDLLRDRLRKLER